MKRLIIEIKGFIIVSKMYFKGRPRSLKETLLWPYTFYRCRKILFELSKRWAKESQP